MESKKFRKVKDFYDNGLWSISRVHDAVVKNWITPAEYEEIRRKNTRNSRLVLTSSN